MPSEQFQSGVRKPEMYVVQACSTDDANDADCVRHEKQTQKAPIQPPAFSPLK